MVDLHTPLSYLSAALPGTGGSLKAKPEDFVVEEIPAYEPVGVGDHLYLWLEKTGVSADALMRRVARALDVDSRDMGSAGLKDTHAVTRQYLSVPAVAEGRLAALEGQPDIRLLRFARHGNKLKTGHLRGNRFRITLRNCHADALPRALAIANLLRAQGVPNFYGTQRFGRGGETLSLGLALLAGDATGLKQAPPARRGFLKRLALSSVQSALFNRNLQQRLDDGLLHTVLLGDVMQVCASGGPFFVTDVAREQGRFEAREVVITGPMFGPKMRAPTDAAGDRERELLAASGLTMAHFEAYAKLMQGTRRPNLVFMHDLEVMEAEPGVICLSFSLPPGAYATVLLREIMKDDDAAAVAAGA